MGVNMRIARFLLPALAALILAGCQKKETSAAAPVAAPAVRVKAIRVEPETFAATVAVTGSLHSRAMVDVKAQTTGRVVRFAKEEGDRVTQGEALVWIDDEQYRLAARQAESAVAVAQAMLERARVQEAYAKSELERARNLLRSGGITDRDLKSAEMTDQDVRAQVALAAAQLDQARAALDVTRKHLRDAVIQAPVDGEIQKKWVNPGAYVEPPTALFTLVDNARLELETSVPAAELAPIRAGQRAAFRISSFPGQTFQGQVVEVLPGVETESRSAKVRIQVPNPDGKLRSGMFAEGEIQTGVTARAFVLPAATVYRDDAAAKSSYVFTVESGKAVRRPVRIGRERDGQSIELAAGVAVEVAGAGK
jgi:RND family efflux transporter MFP subunit